MFRLINLLFGKKYYANIINTRGINRPELSCFIFHNREAAEKHRLMLSSNQSFTWVETISFRSRNKYNI